MAKWEVFKSAEFNGDIVITDPCYLAHGGGKGVLGEWDDQESWISAHGGLVNRTYYGDWGCTVFKTKNEIGRILKGSKSLGEFCADSGRVCVVALKDVLEASPNFDQWVNEHAWCATIIRNFSGTVSFAKRTTTHTSKKFGKWQDTELHVRGDGKIGGRKVSFESIQTSL